jgi:NADH:ubiquinone oxidoreductase subunit 6 (subunit J)
MDFLLQQSRDISDIAIYVGAAFVFLLAVMLVLKRSDKRHKKRNDH